jgi:hypothetical protein
MTEPVNKERSDPHALIHPKPVDTEFVHDLPDAKRISLPTILTHTEFVDSPNCRSQVAFIRDALDQYLEADIMHCDIGGALGCHRHAIQQQSRTLAQPPNPTAQ